MKIGSCLCCCCCYCRCYSFIYTYVPPLCPVRSSRQFEVRWNSQWGLRIYTFKAALVISTRQFFHIFLLFLFLEIVPAILLGILYTQKNTRAVGVRLKKYRYTYVWTSGGEYFICEALLSSNTNTRLTLTDPTENGSDNQDQQTYKPDPGIARIFQPSAAAGGTAPPPSQSQQWVFCLHTD